MGRGRTANRANRAARPERLFAASCGFSPNRAIPCRIGRFWEPCEPLPGCTGFCRIAHSFVEPYSCRIVRVFVGSSGFLPRLVPASAEPYGALAASAVRSVRWPFRFGPYFAGCIADPALFRFSPMRFSGLSAWVPGFPALSVRVSGALLSSGFACFLGCPLFSPHSSVRLFFVLVPFSRLPLLFTRFFRTCSSFCSLSALRSSVLPCPPAGLPSPRNSASRMKNPGFLVGKPGS